MQKIINHTYPVLEVVVEYIDYNLSGKIESGTFYVYGKNGTEYYINQQLQTFMYRNNWRYIRLLSVRKMMAKFSMDVTDYINFPFINIEEQESEKEKECKSKLLK